MAETITIKNTNGHVLYEHTQDNNTIKATVEAAVKAGVDLSHVALYGADLNGINLSGIDLCLADFCNADLSCSNLREANLNSAILANADLHNADLRNANLYKTNLKGVNCRSANIRGANLYDWGELVDGGYLTIGPIGSRDGDVVFWHTDKGIYVMCGCFSGSLDEFVAKVKKTHKDNIHTQNYLAAVEFVKGKFERDNF